MLTRLHCLAAFLYFAGIISAQTEEEKRRYDHLRAEITRHDQLYFREGSSEITDDAYDRLKQEFDALSVRFPQLGQTVDPSVFSDDRTGLFPSRRHLAPMLSLRKARSEPEVRAFDDRLRAILDKAEVVYVVEPKYDGVALSLVYENGHLVGAVTRGNGIEGDDVTENVRALLDVPEDLPGPAPGTVEIRGEAYVTFAQFEDINREREDEGIPPFAHPRALAAGTLKLLDGGERARRRLSFVAHGWGQWLPVEDAPRSSDEFRLRQAGWGIPVARNLGEATTADELWAILGRCGAERRSWRFPTDGVVVKLDGGTAREVVGESASGPNWALAFKFAAETVVTRVEAVTWQVGRTGMVTPVAELTPVTVGGVTVSRATLHSPAHAARLDIRVGDRVEVERAGEVIPHILAVRNESGAVRGPRLDPPDVCPSCRTLLEGHRRAGHLRCPRFDCAAQIERRLEHYVSASAADIRGFGPGLVHALVVQGLVRSPVDLYRLSHDDLMRAGAGGAAAALLAEVERSRSAEVWRIVFGLGIPRIGAMTSRIVAGEAGDLAGLVTLSRATSPTSEHALSAGVRSELVRYFENPDAVALVSALHAAGVGRRKPTVEDERSEAFQGQVVVFTGALAGMTRDQAVSAVTAAGGRVAATVTSRTTLVVAGEGAGSKLDDAHRRGLRVVGEGEFRRLLSGARLQSSQR